jgi:spore coat protein CotH
MRIRFLSILLIAVIVASLGGCSTNTSGNNSKASANADADYSTSLFGKSVITINITADAGDWQNLLDNATSKTYISGNVEINSVTYDNVGIKTKGNTSLSQVANSGSERYSLKINFNKYVDRQECYGLDSLVLNNLYSDNSYLKEYMSYELMDYMDIPSSLHTFADIYVNGVHYGSFLALEDVDESYLERNYGEDYTGKAYKPESMDMEDNGGDAGGGNNAGGGNFGNMSFDITSVLTLTDSKGNEVKWSSVLPDGFDSSAVATVTYKDGGTADFNIRDILSSDLTNIATLTDTIGNTVDISTYTLGKSSSMPQAGGNMQSPAGAGSADAQPTGASGASQQMPDREATASASGNTVNTDGAQNPGNGGNGMGGSLGVNLVYSDDEISSYSNIFDNAITKVDEKDENRLIATLKAISEGKNLENYMDVDEVLRYAAVNVFLVNLDSYFSNMGHNYCLYEDNGKLSMLPWDYNLSFGTYNSSSASDAVNYAVDTVFSGVSAEERPIIGLLLKNEEYLKLYHEYLSQLAEYVTSGKFSEKVDAISAAIDSYVKNDTTSFGGYDAFKTGVEALKTFASLRAASVSGQLDGTIPSTEEGQTDSDALIDASKLSLSDLGTMGGGGQSKNGNLDGEGVTPSQTQGTVPSGNSNTQAG